MKGGEGEKSTEVGRECRLQQCLGMYVVVMKAVVGTSSNP